jgi:competence/damage-inducible protein CinA-like protein
MRAEVVSVGSELLLGQIIDTNSAFIARELAAIGLDLHFKVTVGDNLGRLEEALRQALGRSDVVLTTGGIGPTADDRTREAVARATGRELVFVPALMEQIATFFSARGLTLSPSNRRQAFVPAGSRPLENPLGTAPAFIVEVGDRCVVSLPGVPREMEHLLATRVLPYLCERYGLAGAIRLRVLKTAGLGESRLGELLADLMERGQNPTVGTLAHLGQVDIRIAAKAPSPDEADRLVGPVETEIRRRLGDLVFGADSETLESVVGDLLHRRGEQVAVLESGSGGSVIGRLAVGAPAAFARGAVLGDGGASSEQDPEVRARALAEEARGWGQAAAGLGVCLSPTTREGQPVSAVALCVSLAGARAERSYRFGGDAASTRIRCATLALDLLRRALTA